MQDNENEIAPLERMSPHCDKAKLFQEATFFAITFTYLR